MAIDSDRLSAAVTELLAALGEEPLRPGLQATPRRVAEAFAEFTAGTAVDPLDHLRDELAVDAMGEMVMLRDIRFRSLCEHHLLPFSGRAHLAYLPGARIVGLGRLARVVETLAARLQLQESLTEQIADALNTGLEPRGVLVVVDAHHGCVSSRGSRQDDSSTVTVATRGAADDPVQRGQLMALLGPL